MCKHFVGQFKKMEPHKHCQYNTYKREVLFAQGSKSMEIKRRLSIGGGFKPGHLVLFIKKIPPPNLIQAAAFMFLMGKMGLPLLVDIQ